MIMTLEVKNVTSGYIKEVPVLTNVSIVAEEGYLTGIIGPNGSGKSTSLRLMTGIMRPTRGAVTLTGRVGAMIELAAAEVSVILDPLENRPVTFERLGARLDNALRKCLASGHQTSPAA